MNPSDLSPREGKTLRYVDSHSRAYNEPVFPQMLIVSRKWSDLPQTLLQAKKTLETLWKYGFIERDEVHKKGYRVTPAGIALIVSANAQKLWKSPPPPSVTNQEDV